MTHSGCGYEQAKGGKDTEGKERIEGEKDRNFGGKVCFLSRCERREREETDGAGC